MELEGQFTFDAPQDKVWAVLQDPKVLSRIIPTATNMQKVAENQYTGELFFRVGTMAGAFRGRITLLNLQPPDAYDIEVHGSSSVGQVDIHGSMHLESHDQQTTMFYKGDVQFGGRIASVGSRMLDAAIRYTMDQSFAALNKYLSLPKT